MYIYSRIEIAVLLIADVYSLQQNWFVIKSVFLNYLFNILPSYLMALRIVI